MAVKLKHHSINKHSIFFKSYMFIDIPEISLFIFTLKMYWPTHRRVTPHRHTAGLS